MKDRNGAVAATVEPGNTDQQNENDSECWAAYRHRKVMRLLDRGYTVDPWTSCGHWLQVVAFSDDYTRPRFIATVKFFYQPSSFGIDGGRISKLGIQTIEEGSPCRFRPGEFLFSFERGLDIDRLDERFDAKRFYDSLIEELN